jgi:uncharacterized protein (DUF433 family)
VERADPDFAALNPGYETSEDRLSLAVTPVKRYISSKENKGKDMAALDWSKCSAVESIPGKVSGVWVFKNTRMPVSLVFENLEAGATIDEIMEWFHLTREQIVAVLEFAARSLDPPPPRHDPGNRRHMLVLFDSPAH